MKVVAQMMIMLLDNGNYPYSKEEINIKRLKTNAAIKKDLIYKKKNKKRYIHLRTM